MDETHPSKIAVQFLQTLGEDDFQQILFEDNLVTVSEDGKELGEFNVSIAKGRHEGIECFLVHANSHGLIDSVPCGTSVRSYVSHKLETLEQHHHEYVKLDDYPLDRKTVVTRKAGDYLINRVVEQGGDVQKSTKIIGREEMLGYVSEGSNMLLQRLLIKKGLPQNFQLISLDSKDIVCPVTYKLLESRTEQIQDLPVEVTGIERTLNSTTGPPVVWQAHYTKNGHLVSRVQVGSPVTMKLLTLPVQIQVHEGDEELPKPVFGKKNLKWEDDLEMYSRFLDRKEELKNDHSVYVRQHPELKALMADFLQFLLLRKPDDTVAFAAEYFSSFTTGSSDS